MMSTEEDFYQKAIARMLKLMALLAVTGMAGMWLWRGWSSGAGFAVGAVIAWLNFLWLKRLADALGSEGNRPSLSGAVFLGGRYLILAGVAYVILRYSAISLRAVLAGLFVTLAAAFVEILFELMYARI